jgi:hypothetical protein
MNTKPFFKITEDLLRPCTAKELFVGATFYTKHKDGTFTRCVVDIDTPYYETEKQKQGFRDWVKQLSKDGNIYMRRDKAGHDFRDLYA